MKAKHQFKYTYDEFCENFSPVEVIFDIPTGEVTITQMLWNFECYLKACGFVFDGHLEVVPESGYDVIDDTDYCCMGDTDGLEDEQYIIPPTVKSPSYWDNQPSNICSSDKHNITAEDPKKFFPQHDNGLSTTSSSLDNDWTKADKKLKEWNEGIAKLDNEQKEKANEDARKMSDLHYEATKEVVKNKWVHGMCNPPSPDWKKKNSDRDSDNCWNS
jgi:hypothetical protein